MLRALRVKRSQGHQTIVDLRQARPRGFVGKPELVLGACDAGCAACAEACPTEAITPEPLAIDLGRCIFCTECVAACPTQRIRFTSAPQMASSSRDGLVVRVGDAAPPPVEVSASIRRMFGRSLKLRQVSAGGCNACELELNAAANVNFDFGRYGIDWVASPRHADALVLSGPLTANMADAVELAYAAMPEPKLVISFGACAISGGLYEASGAIDRRFLGALAPALYVPGCPPHPLTFVVGLLDLLGIGVAPSGAEPPAPIQGDTRSVGPSGYDPATLAQGHATADRLSRAVGADLRGASATSSASRTTSPEPKRRLKLLGESSEPK